MRFLVSAGEASGDMYAAGLVQHLQAQLPDATFFGCAGPKLQALGVKPVIDVASLSVVGLAEVVAHLPRIYGEYRKLLNFARSNPPTAAILTDNPDFHLRLARHLKRMRIPVFYLVAPQVWAWRQGRVRIIKRLVDELFCLFPFEQRWFRERGVNATYIGHPLAYLARTTCSKAEFYSRHHLPVDRRTVVLLPGSRAGEAVRHLPIVLDAVEALKRKLDLSFLLATPKGFEQRMVLKSFRERIRSLSIQVVENESWDSIGHADLALAASGTVTMEAAVLGTPMVTFYKVTSLSWYAGRWLVKVPFLSMVNLIAERGIVPELIQADMTAEKLVAAAVSLLEDPDAAAQMRKELARVKQSLMPEVNPYQQAANIILQKLQVPQETMK